MKMPFVLATGLPNYLLTRYGLAGITMPWGTVYLHKEYFRHRALRRHELFHLRQIRRDGAITFSVKYLFWLFRYGYWGNPYELEAYASAPLYGE